MGTPYRGLMAMSPSTVLACQADGSSLGHPARAHPIDDECQQPISFGRAVRIVLGRQRYGSDEFEQLDDGDLAREQRCWFHKIANVLNCLPKSA